MAIVEAPRVVHSEGQHSLLKASSLGQTKDVDIIQTVITFVSEVAYVITYIFRRIIIDFAFPATSWTMYSSSDVQRLHEQLKNDLSTLPEGLKGKCEEIPVGSGKFIRGFSIQSTKKTTSKNCLLYFCENVHMAENRFEFCKTLAEQGDLTVFCFSYPGSGLSDGIALSEDEFLDYGRACIDFARGQPDQIGRLILWGHSFGGALATLLGKECEDAGYDTAIVNDRSPQLFPKLVYNMYPPVARAILDIGTRVFGLHFDTRAVGLEIRSKIAIISATYDRLIETDNQFCNIFPKVLPPNFPGEFFPYGGDHFNLLEEKTAKRILDCVQSQD